MPNEENNQGKRQWSKGFYNRQNWMTPTKNSQTTIEKLEVGGKLRLSSRVLELRKESLKNPLRFSQMSETDERDWKEDESRQASTDIVVVIHASGNESQNQNGDSRYEGMGWVWDTC